MNDPDKYRRNKLQNSLKIMKIIDVLMSKGYNQY